MKPKKYVFIATVSPLNGRYKKILFFQYWLVEGLFAVPAKESSSYMTPLLTYLSQSGELFSGQGTEKSVVSTIDNLF